MLFTGKPAKTPVDIAVSKPFVIAGTNSLGIDPPNKSLTNWKAFLSPFSFNHSSSAGPIEN